MTATARCLTCGHQWQPLLRRARFRHAVCPSCGGTDLAETEVLSMIPAGSAWAERTLAELGLPRAHVHVIVDDNDADALPVHLEITGDVLSTIQARAC
jgi:hypothetical protein